MDDEELRDRDWLDWVYMGSRAALLIMILYFYSSIERFIFVVLCMLGMYGLNAGWFNLRRRPEPGEEPPRRNEPPQPEEITPEEAEQPGEDPEVSEPVEGEEPATTEPPQELPPTQLRVFCSTCVTFVTTFFTSLIPERPPPINFN